MHDIGADHQVPRARLRSHLQARSSLSRSRSQILMTSSTTACSFSWSRAETRPVGSPCSARTSSTPIGNWLSTLKIPWRFTHRRRERRTPPRTSLCSSTNSSWTLRPLRRTSLALVCARRSLRNVCCLQPLTSLIHLQRLRQQAQQLPHASRTSMAKLRLLRNRRLPQAPCPLIKQRCGGFVLRARYHWNRGPLELTLPPEGALPCLLELTLLPEGALPCHRQARWRPLMRTAMDSLTCLTGRPALGRRPHLRPGRTPLFLRRCHPRFRKMQRRAHLQALRRDFLALQPRQLHPPSSGRLRADAPCHGVLPPSLQVPLAEAETT